MIVHRATPAFPVGCEDWEQKIKNAQEIVYALNKFYSESENGAWSRERVQAVLALTSFRFALLRLPLTPPKLNLSSPTSSVTKELSDVLRQPAFCTG